MALDLDTLVKQLTESSIIAQGKLENFVPPKAQPKNADELIAELVKQNQLTNFQAQQIKAGKSKALILGSYTILDKIGAGGMGQVFKAEHRRMKRQVAIKMLPPAMMKDAAAAARFQREVEAAAKLNHSNIVTAHDADQANGVHFLVMEYVEGKDLSALVKKNGPFPVAKAVNYILQAARGLEFAHKKGVVHRDIKPANLLLDNDGTVKILDMGLARIEQPDGGVQAELTGTGAIMGTVDYMAPEQGLSTKHADARADIYSLGCSLYYLIAGQATYDGETVAAKLLAHHTHPIPDLRKAHPEVPEQLDAVFKKMVAKRIEDRYQTMTEVVADLEKCQTVIREGGSSATSVFSASSTSQPSDMSILLQHGQLRSIYGEDSPQAFPVETPPKTKAKPKTSVGGAWYQNRNMLIGAGAAGFLCLALGVWAIVRDKSGNEVATVKVPAGGSVEVKTDKPAAANAKSQPPSTFTVGGGGKITTYLTPEFKRWEASVRFMSPDKQIEAVRKKLMELNPGFDGKLTGLDQDFHPQGSPKVVNGAVTEISFSSDDVTDLSPIRAFSGLKVFRCAGVGGGKISRLSDLSPLAGMELTKLNCFATKIADLSPLSGMPLTELHCQHSNVSNLAPLAGMPIKSLLCEQTKVTELSPLRGTPLTLLNCSWTQVADLSPLRECPRLNHVLCPETNVSDLSPLAELNDLYDVSFTPQNITKGLDLLRQKKSLVAFRVSRRNNAAITPAEFWKKYDAGEFSKPAAPAKLAYLDPAFQQWIADTQKLTPEQQIEAVSKKLQELNPGFDGSIRGYDQKAQPKVENGVVTEIGFWTDKVTDISPVRSLTRLRWLDCRGSQAGKGILSDLSPLEGMRLEYVYFNSTKVSDLKPLAGMPLARAMFSYTDVSDLSPLRGMNLENLDCTATQVSDLSPLAGMPLTILRCDKPVADISPLATCEDLKFLFLGRAKVTADQVAALQKALPNCKIEWDGEKAEGGGRKVEGAAKKLAYLDPAFQAWVKATQALPAEQQIEAVSKKLMELNPGFDGKMTGYDGEDTPKIVNGVVKEFGIITDNVEDVSPVRAFIGLNALSCNDSGGYKGKLSDLSPLAGMKLARLSCGGSQVSDLSPLQGLPLHELRCNGTPVASLSPLQGMHLTYLNCGTTQVSDLSPLRGMPLKSLSFYSTNVSDLSPLQGMQLTGLFCNGTPVFDLSALQGMNLVDVLITPRNITKGLDVVRQMKSIKTIGYEFSKTFPPAEFWKKYDAGDFGKPAAKKLAYLDPTFQQWLKETQKLPAEKQIDAVSKKLMELNPGFDGEVTDFDGKGTPKIENGVVTEIVFGTDSVTDLSPVRALSGLKILRCEGSSSSKCSLSDLSALQGMQLRRLECGHSKVSDLSPLRGMPLSLISIGSSQVSDLSPLKEMPLTYLGCYNTPVSDLTPLQGCKSLKIINLTGTKLPASSVTALQKALPNCKIEWDDPTTITSGSDSERALAQSILANLDAKNGFLKVLIQSKEYTLKKGDSLPVGSLRIVEIGTCDVFNDDELRRMANLPQLVTLSIRLRGATAAGVRELRRSPALTDFYVPSGLTLDEPMLSAILELKQLQRFKFHGGKLTADQIAAFRALPNLTEFGIRYCYEPIDAALVRLGEYPRLQLLMLDNNPQLTDAGLEHIKKVKGLTLLKVGGTKVTASGIAALQKALPNCKIEWDDPSKPKTSEPAAAGTK